MSESKELTAISAHPPTVMSEDVRVQVKRADRRRQRTPFTAELLLTPADLAEFVDLLVDPRATLKVACEWVWSRGYTALSQSAVYRYRCHVRAGYKETVHWASVGIRMAAASRRFGPVAVIDGTLAYFERNLLQLMKRLEDPTTLSMREWAELAATMSKTVGTRNCVEEIRHRHQERVRKSEKEKAQPMDDQTPEEKAAAAGPILVARMRRILGLDDWSGGEEEGGKCESV